jgi:hypothetical protein
LFAIGHPAGLETEVLSVGQYTAHELQQPLNPHAKAINRPIAGIKHELPVLDGSSGSPVFNRDGKVVSVVAVSDTNRLSAGSSVEHVHSLLDQVKQINPRRGWITVNSRAAMLNESDLAKPISVTASAIHGTRVGLAERFNWQPPGELYGSALLGLGRRTVISGTHELLWDIARLTGGLPPIAQHSSDAAEPIQKL